MPVVFTPYLRKAKERIATDDDGRGRPKRPADDGRGQPDRAADGPQRPRKRWLAVGAALTAAMTVLLARRARRDESSENSK